jgi:hypothetical protein
MEVSGQLHAPAAYPREKSLRYLLNRTLGGPQSWSGRGGGEKKFLPCRCWESNPARLAYNARACVRACMRVRERML